MNTKKYSIPAYTLILMMASCAKENHVELLTAKAERGEMVETVTATGTLESVTQVDVGTQVTGIISHLYADYNSVVKQGQLIAELDKTILQSDVTSAEANVEAAKLTYDYNLTNFNRDKQLHARQLISDYEFQTSQNQVQVSKTTYDKALADKVRADKNLNYAEIYSPIDGIVISRDVEVGQTVVSNMSVANLFTIADLDHMQVIGNVDEADIGQVRQGQTVTFTVDAFPDDLFTGEVKQVRLSPTTVSNVVTYEVVVSADNPDHKLIPGLTANLTIFVTEESGALTLPVQAFNFRPQPPVEDDGSELPLVKGKAEDLHLGENQKCVWVLSGNTLSPRAVTIGEENGIKASITAGLEEGETIAIGYSGPTGNEEDHPDASGTKQSPFAPQPPGGKKK